MNILNKLKTQSMMVPRMFRLGNRSFIQSAEGNIKPMPFKMKCGIIPVGLVISCFVYSGAMIAHRGAFLLEEFEIYVHNDDDDDDFP